MPSTSITPTISVAQLVGMFVLVLQFGAILTEIGAELVFLLLEGAVVTGTTVPLTPSKYVVNKEIVYGDRHAVSRANLSSLSIDTW